VLRAEREDGEISTFATASLGKYTPPADDEEEVSNVVYKAKLNESMVLIIIVVVIVLILAIGVIVSLFFLKRTRKIKLERKRSDVMRRNSEIIAHNEEIERQ